MSKQWRYEVVVGNIGTVYSGDDEAAAKKMYREYVTLSKSGHGRVGNEEVTLFVDGELDSSYFPEEPYINEDEDGSGFGDDGYEI